MDLSRRVRVAAVGCEETGLVGSEHLASRLDPAAVVNVDGAGRFRDLVAMTHTSDETAAVAERVGEEAGHPVRVKTEPHPFSDQWPFVRRGVPALQLHSDSGERGRGWAHTAADTRDKVDRRTLRDHAMLTALLVHELAARDPPRLDRDALTDAFRAADFEPGMRAAGLWPDAWE
jgi:Zn-dependent M28 family amino/carboxypeptidase